MDEFVLDLLSFLMRYLNQSCTRLLELPKEETYINASREVVKECGYNEGINDVCQITIDYVIERYRVFLNSTDHCITKGDESQDKLVRGDSKNGS